MKKRILSLVLALALCLGLAAPALAAGTAKTFIDKTHGVTITMHEYLRTDTHTYLTGEVGPTSLTIHVVADNSTVEVVANQDRQYAVTDEDIAKFEEFWEYPDESGFAYSNGICYDWVGYDDNLFWFPSREETPLNGAKTYAMTPTEESGSAQVNADYSVLFMCESDFAKLVPFQFTPWAADWAEEDLTKAYEEGLFNETSIDLRYPLDEGISRMDFAGVTVSLYAAAQDKGVWELDIDSNHPFDDVYHGSIVGCAYNLGFVNGTSETTFAPDSTLTREQAAVMLSRVYAKLRGDIPAVTTTTFADDASIGSWAKSSVAFMADKSIVNGVGNNNFAPQQTLSIQEAMVMAQRMLENLK